MTQQESADGIVEILKNATSDGERLVGHFEILEVDGRPSCSWSILGGDEVSDLFAIPCHQVASLLGVLGNEVRLAILRELIVSPKSVVQLTEILGMRTTGQAYHHLKELQRAGYVADKKGDKYSIDMKFGRIYVAALGLAWNAHTSLTRGDER
ncbi:MAG: winged helix-turn-helix domain-containing protein [Fimbriimonas sp.]|nr:winged helix-turn-helix domain-containing protein [Fimbriimonas sp.]